MSVGISHLCRSCMIESPEMVSIFNSNTLAGTELTLSDMLMACASVDITTDDGLPIRICKCCIDQLQTAFQFKQRCERSDVSLREYLTNPHIELIKAEDDAPDTEVLAGDTENGKSEIVPDWKPVNNQVAVCAKKSRTKDKKSPLKISESVTKKWSVDELVSEAVEDESGANTLVKDDSNGSNGEIYETLASYLVEVVEDSLQKQVPQPVPTAPTNGYLCKVCQKEFSCARYLMKHSKTHSLVYEYQCTYCEKSFSNQNALTTHEKIHTRLYLCHLCDKKFKSPHGLVYHIKRHNGIKDYTCPIEMCGKAFIIKQALNKHMTLHTSEKKHLCPECGKAYSTIDAFSYHLKQHKGQRPFLCIHCGKTFKQSCHLKTHMWVHSGIKPYHCKVCGIRYTTGHQLKRHRRGQCGNVLLNEDAVAALGVETIGGLNGEILNEGPIKLESMELFA